MFDPDLPSTIIRRVLHPLEIVSAQAMVPGMSGASVYQCQLATGQRLALKRWPDGTSRSRIEEVHRVMAQARQCGCQLVPSLTVIPGSSGSGTLFTVDQAHYELSQWMPGIPADADASLDAIRRGAAVIADFHRSIGSLGVIHQPPPAVQARLSRLKQLETKLPEALGSIERWPVPAEIASAINDAARLLRWNWDQARQRMTRSLGVYTDRPMSTQYVLRDVHRDHVLFDHDGVPTGLIDFDAVRVDTPATDLARWVGSFLDGRSDAESVWRSALAGFGQQNLFNDWGQSELNDFAKALSFSTTWISLANWMVWVVCEERTFRSGGQIISRRISELVRLASHET